MVTKFKKWGNSLAVRISKSLAREVQAQEGMKVEALHDAGRIVLIPQRRRKRRKYTLEELVARITPENRHEEVDFGPPVGRELF